MKYKAGKTERGFEFLHFNDENNECCELMRSSASGKSKIWLGTKDPNPMILASKTKEGGTGWVRYPVPDDVLINHRIHLSRRQSISLALKLLKFGLFNLI